MKYMSIMVFVIVLILGCLSCGSDTAAPDIDPETQIGTLNISMDDFKFTPDKIDVKVGQRIRLVLNNSSAANDHSFSVGYGIIDQDDGGKAFKTDLFESVEVNVAGSVKLIKSGTTLLIHDGNGDVENNCGGFVIVKSPSSESTIIEFTVPNKIGEFEFASFANDGRDYKDGMKGLLNVFPKDDDARSWQNEVGSAWRQKPTPIPNC